MPDEFNDLPVIGYPRVDNCLRYGSLERLEALRAFTKDFDTPLVGLPVIVVLFEGGSFFYAANHNALLMVFVMLGGMVIYGTVWKTTDLFVRFRGGKVRPSHAVATGVLALAVVGPLVNIARPGTVLLPLVLLVIGIWMLVVSNREAGRYGVKIKSFSKRSAETAFTEAIEQRRAWDQNPLPPIPADLYSGEASSG